MATQLPRSQRLPTAPAKADDPTAVPQHGSDKAGDVLPFPVADVPPGVLIRAGRFPHRFAGTPVDETTVRSIHKRLSKTVHVRLTDSVQVGENEFEERREPWLTWFGRKIGHSYGFDVACILTAAFACSLMAAAILSAAGRL